MRKKSIKLLAAAVSLILIVGMVGCGEKDSGKEKNPIVIAGSTSMQPLSEVLAENYMDRNNKTIIEVQGGGSGQGIKSIETKIADIGSLSRDVKEDERASVAKEIVIAKDGIAMVVNKDVRIENLTLKQLRDIYTGKIKNWKVVGGQDKPITIISREEGSGTRSAFSEVTGVLTKDKAGNVLDKTKDSALVQPSNGAVIKTVEKVPSSIGYVSIGTVNDNVKMLKIEKKEATIANILSEKYPLQRPFIYVIGNDASDVAKDYLDYVLSSEGQNTIEENGFVPIK